jgi:hypothetical protein
VGGIAGGSFRWEARKERRAGVGGGSEAQASEAIICNRAWAAQFPFATGVVMLGLRSLQSEGPLKSAPPLMRFKQSTLFIRFAQVTNT